MEEVQSKSARVARHIVNKPTRVHSTADIDPSAVLGSGVEVWNWSKIRERARVGDGTNIGQGVYIDRDVTIGHGCKIQNGCSLYLGVTIADHVFVGPHVTFTNDLRPRTFVGDWKVMPTVVSEGAAIGANATIVCGVVIGEYAMVAAGAVVTSDVPAYGLVAGCPARLIDYVDVVGDRLYHELDKGPPDAQLLHRADRSKPEWR